MSCYSIDVLPFFFCFKKIDSFAFIQRFDFCDIFHFALLLLILKHYQYEIFVHWLIHFVTNSLILASLTLVKQFPNVMICCGDMNVPIHLVLPLKLKKKYFYLYLCNLYWDKSVLHSHFHHKRLCSSTKHVVLWSSKCQSTLIRQNG